MIGDFTLSNPAILNILHCIPWKEEHVPTRKADFFLSLFIRHLEVFFLFSVRLLCFDDVFRMAQFFKTNCSTLGKLPYQSSLLIGCKRPHTSTRRKEQMNSSRRGPLKRPLKMPLPVSCRYYVSLGSAVLSLAWLYTFTSVNSLPLI